MRCALLLLHAEGVAGQVFNLGSGIARSIGDAGETLARLLGRTELRPKVTMQFRKGDVRHCVADIRRARTVLGFSPAVTWEAGLQELIDWARSAPSADRFGRAHQELVTHGLLSGPLEAATGECR